MVFHDCVAFADGELAGVEVGSPVENVIPESVYSTAFEFDGKTYKAKSNIQKIKAVIQCVNKSTKIQNSCLISESKSDWIPILIDLLTYKAKSNIQTINNVANIREELYKNGFYCDGIKYVRFKRCLKSQHPQY